MSMNTDLLHRSRDTNTATSGFNTCMLYSWPESVPQSLYCIACTVCAQNVDELCVCAEDFLLTWTAQTQSSCYCHPGEFPVMCSSLLLSAQLPHQTLTSVPRPIQPVFELPQSKTMHVYNVQMLHPDASFPLSSLTSVARINVP